MSMELKTGKPEDAGLLPERVRRVQELAESWVKDGLTPALIVMAARKGVIFLHEAWGILGPEPDAPPVRKDTIFGIASISKTLTATAVMLLVEGGYIGLNRPVQEYIPEFKGKNKDKVMVRHLLTHTSGLSDEDVHALEEFAGDSVKAPPPEPTHYPGMQEWLNLCYHAPLRHPPGGRMLYSNEAYELLGEIVRRVSGQSFSDFTRQRIFEPLGMLDTYFSLPAALRERTIRRRPGTTYDWGEDIDPYERPCPAGCAHSTAMDLARFGQTFLNEGSYGDVHLLSPATVAAMTRDQVGDTPSELIDGEPAPPSGFGWFLFGRARFRRTASLYSPDSFLHTGASGAVLWVDPVYQIVGVLLFQKVIEGVWPDDLFINAVTAAIVHR